MKKQQKLEAPLNEWMMINTTDDGQGLYPTESFQWLDAKGSQVYIKPDGKVAIAKDEILTENFGPVVWESLHSYQIKNLNKRLNDDFSIETEFENIIHLRLFGSKQGLFKVQYLAYDLFVYFNQTPEYILVCIDYCHNIESRLVRVYKR